MRSIIFLALRLGFPFRSRYTWWLCVIVPGLFCGDDVVRGQGVELRVVLGKV